MRPRWIFTAITLAGLSGCYRDASQAAAPLDPGPPPDAEARDAHTPHDPRPGFHWIAGRWARSGDRWVWLDGYYAPEHAGYRWEQGHWVAVARPGQVQPAATMQWAASVRDVSSQYSVDGWSAQQALGPPDVFPQQGDMPKAWASALPDAPTEYLEVGYAAPQRAAGVQVFETFNPGAIQEIDLITPTQTHVFAPGASAAQPLTLRIPCTSEPVIAVRITLDSASVPGWNEIDAVGLMACP